MYATKLSALYRFEQWWDTAHLSYADVAWTTLGWQLLAGTFSAILDFVCTNTCDLYAYVVKGQQILMFVKT